MPAPNPISYPNSELDQLQQWELHDADTGVDLSRDGFVGPRR
jgi:hypothetical protein